MAFIDEVNIRVHSGAGGDGCISFRREKYVPRGGPNGGNGGTGGSIKFLATRNKRSLLDFKYQPIFRAERGQHGLGKDMNGHAGEDRVIQVPAGTQIYDPNTGDLIYDLVSDGNSFEVLKGGKGGRGNKSYATSTNRAPRIAEPGESGKLMELKLELRLLADAGLIGLPNAGKSSLLRKVSRAHPKAGDYPFTTLEPNLGVFSHRGQSYVLADLPGLIEGAASGAGLGHKFLRHATRNRILLHLVDASLELQEIKTSINTIRNELEAFDPSLTQREELLVFTKSDLMNIDVLEDKQKALAKEGYVGTFISNLTGAGIETLLDRITKLASLNIEAPV